MTKINYGKSQSMEFLIIIMEKVGLRLFFHTEKFEQGICNQIRLKKFSNRNFSKILMDNIGYIDYQQFCIEPSNASII